MTNIGGILSTWLLGSLSPPPKYTKASITFVVFAVGMVVCTGLNLLYLSRENKKKAEKRRTTPKQDEAEGLGDRSAWFVYLL